MRVELTAWFKTWWCRGGGAAVLFLLVVVTVYRQPHDAIFWLAIAFFVGHTAMAALRYRRERRIRAEAVVIRHHQADVTLTHPVVFLPHPINSLISLKKPPQQIKKAI